MRESQTSWQLNPNPNLPLRRGVESEMKMGLFKALVSTAINVATLPVAVAKDVVTLGGVSTDQRKPYTVQKLQQIKDEAEG